MTSFRMLIRIRSKALNYKETFMPKDWHTCDNCGSEFQVIITGINGPSFCPNCGSDLETEDWIDEEAEEEDYYD